MRKIASSFSAVGSGGACIGFTLGRHCIQKYKFVTLSSGFESLYFTITVIFSFFFSVQEDNKWIKNIFDIFIYIKNNICSGHISYYIILEILENSTDFNNYQRTNAAIRIF